MKTIKEKHALYLSNDKISKYLEIENVKIWHLKTTTMPVLMEALSMIKRKTDPNINKISDSLILYVKQKKKKKKKKKAHYGTTHLLRRVLSMGLKNITHKKQKKYEYIDNI